MILWAALVEPPFSTVDFFVKKSRLMREKEVGMTCSRRADVEKMWDGDLADEELEKVTFHMDRCEECATYFKMRMIGTDSPRGLAEIEADTDTERRRKLKKMKGERIFRGLVYLVIGIMAVGTVCLISLVRF